MDKIDLQAVANLSQNDHQDSQPRYSPSLRQKKLINALWVRMGQLYGHKWSSQEGPATMENGAYSTAFILWCRKTEGLTDEAWQRGFNQIEFLVKEAARQGEEAWPPSYAGFIGYCERAHGELAHKYFPQLGLEDKTKRERDLEIRKSELKKIQDLLVDTSET